MKHLISRPVPKKNIVPSSIPGTATPVLFFPRILSAYTSHVYVRNRALQVSTPASHSCALVSVIALHFQAREGRAASVQTLPDSPRLRLALAGCRPQRSEQAMLAGRELPLYMFAFAYRTASRVVVANGAPAARRLACVRPDVLGSPSLFLARDMPEEELKRL